MHLPQEIHDVIIAQLAHKDLSNYRLVNQNFAHAAVDKLFRNVSFNTELSHLKQIACIACQEHLCRHVRYLTWHSTKHEIAPFLEHITKEELEELRDLLPGQSKDIISKALKIPRESGQPKGKIGILVLQSILVCFRNLFILDVCVWDKIKVGKKGRGLIMPNFLLPGEYEMITFLTAAYEAGCSIMKFSMGSPPYRPLFRHNIWPALEKVCAELTTLELGVGFCLSAKERQEGVWNIDAPLPKAFDVVYSALSTSDNAASFKAFLCSLVNLRCLKLKFRAGRKLFAPGNHNGYMTDPVLMDILPSEHTWKYLHELELWEPSTTTEFMKRFLGAHKESLRKVKFGQVKFRDCSGAENSCESVRNYMATEMQLEKSNLNPECFLCM